MEGRGRDYFCFNLAGTCWSIVSFSRLSSKLLSVSCKEEERESRYKRKGKKRKERRKDDGGKVSIFTKKSFEEEIRSEGEEQRGKRGGTNHIQ